METVTLYTTCPATYDYPRTKEVRVVARTRATVPKDVRQVVVDAKYIDAQLGRYASSGTGAVFTEEEWSRMAGLVDPVG